MSDIRQYPKGNTRQIVDYNRFVSLTGNKVFLCLDAGILEMLKKLMNSRGSWRSTYAVEWQDHLYIMPTEEEFKVVTNAIAEANLDMASCNDIVEAIQNIATMLQNQGCCGGSSGSRGSGQTEQAPNPYDQGETPETPPPGFSSMEQFDTRKCNAALDLLNNLQSDLIGLAGITYSGSSPTGLVGALILFLLTPIPFDDLVGLAAYLIYSAYSYTFLAEMASVIEDNEDELTCILYNSVSAEAAKSDLLARLEELAIAHFTTTDDAEWVMGAVEQMIPYDATNLLFENVPTVSTGADCSACNTEGAMFTIIPAYDVGEFVGEPDANPILIQTEFFDGWGCASLAREVAVSVAVPITVTSVTVTDGPGACGAALIHHWYANDDLTDVILETNGLPQIDGPVVGVRSFFILYSSSVNPVITISYTVD